MNHSRFFRLNNFLDRLLGRVDIHFVQMKALTMTSMDTKALGVCS